MSDFDDEPVEAADGIDDEPGAPADAIDDEPGATADVIDDEPGGEAPAPRRAKAPVPDDDWDDDWDDDDDGRGGGRRDMTLVYAVIAAAVVIVLAIVLTRPKGDDNGGSGDNGSATTAATVPAKNWQGGVGDAAGEAQKRAESAAGVYIWTDFGGWHLRNNGSGEVKVTVAADEIRVKKSDDGKDDDENPDATPTTETTVTLPAGDGSEGVGLDLGSSERVTYTVTADGKAVDAAAIKLGGGEAQADQNPVTLVKE